MPQVSRGYEQRASQYIVGFSESNLSLLPLPKGPLEMYGEGVVVVDVDGECKKYVRQRARELGTDVLPFSE